MCRSNRCSKPKRSQQIILNQGTAMESKTSSKTQTLRLHKVRLHPELSSLRPWHRRSKREGTEAALDKEPWKFASVFLFLMLFLLLSF